MDRGIRTPSYMCCGSVDFSSASAATLPRHKSIILVFVISSVIHRTDDAAMNRGQTLKKKEKNGKSSSSSNKNITRPGSKKDIYGPTTSPQLKQAKKKIYVQPGNQIFRCEIICEGMHSYIDDYDPDAQEKYEQLNVESNANSYRSSCYYGPEYEKRTCIWSGGDPFSWEEKSTGISWIGVNGTEATCVLAMSEQDVKRLPPSGRTQLAIIVVLGIALADMGVWADTSTASTEFRRRIAQSSKAGGPFAVVSVAPGTVVEDHLESSHGPSHAINFLEEKLKDRSALTSTETTRLAVCALKYLLGPKFNSDMIESQGSGKWRGCIGRMCAFEVREHLAAINQTDNRQGFAYLQGEE